MMGVGWSDEWPREAGWYWFYGYDHHCGEEPRLEPVHVRGPMMTGGYMYVTGGRFLYRSEGARGVWLRIDVPDLPELREER